MNSLNRRDMLVAFSSLAALAVVPVSGEAQAGTNDGVLRSSPGVNDGVARAQEGSGEPVLSVQRTFRFAELPVSKNENGEVRAVTHGVLPTGETVELHETSLLPGHMPHPPHRHRHSEFILIREGDLEFENNGTPERVGPGGVIFVASNVLHGLKNIGTTTAQYFVVAIGRDMPVEKV